MSSEGLEELKWGIGEDTGSETGGQDQSLQAWGFWIYKSLPATEAGRQSATATAELFFRPLSEAVICWSIFGLSACGITDWSWGKCMPPKKYFKLKEAAARARAAALARAPIHLLLIKLAILNKSPRKACNKHDEESVFTDTGTQVSEGMEKYWGKLCTWYNGKSVGRSLGLESDR